MSFFSTAGRGTEVFVAKELFLRQIDSKDHVNVTDGKVFFHCNASSFSKLFHMKTVERTFVQIDHFKTSELDSRGKMEFLNSLSQRIITTDKLENVVSLYRQVQKMASNKPGENATDKNEGTAGCVKEPSRGVGEVLVTEEEEEEEPERKKQKLDVEGDSVSFRVNCKVAGYWGSLFRSRQGRGNQMDYLAGYFGKKIVNTLKWKTDLRRPDIEICIFVNDEVVTVGIPITRSPLSKRSYIFRSGLRQTVAWMMAYLADIQVGDIVLDPMCGKATILIEGAKEHQKGQYLGMDIDTSQLADAVQNRSTSSTGAMLHLAQANVNDLPLRDRCVDKVVCDAPFGCKYSAGDDLNTFYPHLLHQIHRVLKSDGIAVVMTSSYLKKMFLDCIYSSKSEESSSSQTLTDLQKKNLADSQNADPTEQEQTTLGVKPSESSSSQTLADQQENLADLQKDDLPEQEQTTLAVKPSVTSSGTDKHASSCNSDCVIAGNQTQIKLERNKLIETHSKQNNSSTKIPLFVSVEHYVKLGETEAVIFVLKKK